MKNTDKKSILYSPVSVMNTNPQFVSEKKKLEFLYKIESLNIGNNSGQEVVNAHKDPHGLS